MCCLDRRVLSSYVLSLGGAGRKLSIYRDRIASASAEDVGMTAAEPVAGDLRCRFAGGFPCGGLPGCASGLLGQIQSAVRWLLTGRGTDWRGGPWEWGFGHPKGRWDRRGSEAGWWPGPPG